MSEPTTAGRPLLTRRTQAERSAATREALLDATIDCLVDHGYAGATTPTICRRAGVSRGAQVHHFPTKADLVAQALEHLTRRRSDELRGQLLELGPERDLRSALLALWSAFDGPLFIAATELWVAARTDPDLGSTLRPIERGIGRIIRELVHAIFPEAVLERPDFERNFQSVLNMMRGLGISAGIREGVVPIDPLIEVAIELLQGPEAST